VRARLALASSEVTVDLARPIVIAITQEFNAGQPRHFGAPPASSRPLAVPGFSGAVASGASCNCQVLTLIPHCNGTHTECVGHLTVAAVHAQRIIPPGLLPAVLVSVTPCKAGSSEETTTPSPQPGDLLITREALEAAWPGSMPFVPTAVIIRTLPNDSSKLTRDYSDGTPPYLTRDAAQWLVGHNIEHVVVDVPSLDRSHDEGHLTVHRVFFGLPPRSSDLQAARRVQATVTELAFVPGSVRDGCYMLELQAPALDGDAVPSRPLLYELLRP
jgi:arylformamidase